MTHTFWTRATNTHNPNLCWEWTGALTSRGYGSLQTDNTKWLAHRYAYTITNGPIPNNQMICHTCDNPKCVNPQHLYAGTHTDNMQDMVNKHRHHELNVTHCPQGHEYTPENTYRQPSRPNQRICRTCKQQRDKQRNRHQYMRQYQKTRYHNQKNQ